MSAALLAPAVGNALHATRESWLAAFAAAARPRFEEAGAPLPTKVRLSIGFPSGGRRVKAIGECWSDVCSGDGVFEIFITPAIGSAARIADILTHELVHAAVGLEAKHGPRFRKIAVALGLQGKMTATVAGPGWWEWAQPILDALGPLPHAALNARSSSAKPKQTTRNIKVVCPNCGFTFRTTRKWIEHAGDYLACPDASCAASIEVPA
jgi:hypothetical protein